MPVAVAVAPLAHIVQGAPLPTALGWVAACLIAAGAAAIFLGRGGSVEVMGWITFAAGFCGAGGVVAVTALVPTSARITISLAAPAASPAGAPVDVTVCGRATAGGSPATAPDGSNVLAVLVDGRETAVENTGSFALLLPPGRHAVRVELLTNDHHVFSPRVAADATITVGGQEALAALSCR
jgi:hypothetical protein